MSADVELRPGLMPLIHWRAIYRGAPVALDPFARPDAEAGAAALAELLAHQNLPPPEAGAPSIAELMEAGGDRLPSPLVRLFVALKLASLAQGMSGMRWETLRGIEDFLGAGLLPAVPAEEISDRLALSTLFAALTGTGEVVMRDKRRPAAKALKEAELFPLELNPQERSALLSGTSLSTAAALAGLFEAERVFHSALVATALSATAPPRPTIPLHPRVHRLYRQPGQIEVAASLRALTGMTEAGGAQVNDENGAEEKARRGAPLKMGACLDLLRQAGATLERAANAVTEDPMILWQSGEVVAGALDRSSVAGAADLIAKALTTIAELSAAHIAALTCAAGADGDADTEQANATARAGGFVGRIRELADRSSDMRRLLPMAGTATLVLAIEFLEAGRACDAAPEREAPELNDVLRLVREAAPHADEAGLFPAGDLAAIADRVGSGALAAAAGMPLPGVVRRPAEREASR